MTCRRACLAVALALLGVSLGACTPEAAAPRAAVTPAIEPKADEALKAMCDALAGAKAFSFEVTSYMDEPLATGQFVQLHRHSKVVAVRPDKLHVETEGDDCRRMAWYDGRTVTVLDRAGNTYAVIDAPNRTEDMLDFLVEQYGLTIPLADVLFPNLYEVLTGNVLSGVYLGVHTAGGQACHHLAFRQEMVDWQVWIDAGTHPVPRKLLITYTREPGQPHYVANLDGWDLSASPPIGQFTFEAPDGIKRVKMTELLGIAEGDDQ
jgi:hypothetical protein